MSEMKKEYLFLNKQTSIVLVLLGLLGSLSTFAIGGGPQPMGGLKNAPPIDTSDVGITEHLGDTVDLSLTFTNEVGEKVPLSHYFSKGKPVFLVMVYYNCPTLCNTHMNAMFDVFKDFNWTLGNEWQFVAVSIDPEESHVLAKMKKDSYMEVYGREEAQEGMHFLTGEEENIKKLASQVGFGYKKIPLSDDWAHSAAAYVLTPDGKISYYHYGVSILPQVLRLSLVEASEYKIGNVMDRLVLFCLQYDPNKKTYAFYAYNLMRVGGVLTVLIFGFILYRFWRRQRSTEN